MIYSMEVPSQRKKKMCSLKTNKTEHKKTVFFTISDIWQFENASAQSVSTSEHFHHHWDVFTPVGIVSMHSVRIKRDKGNGGPLSPILTHQASKAQFPGNDIQNNETIPTCRVCSVHEANVSHDRLSQQGSSHMHTVCGPSWCMVTKSH